MKWTAYIREGVLNLISSKLRSVLALLGILVGTASVVAMVLGGELATNEALKQFKTLGTDLLAVTILDSPSEEKNAAPKDNLSITQANQLITADKAILDVAPYVQIFDTIRYNGSNLGGTTLGVTDAFERIVHIEIDQGRFISNLDGTQFYCVIGQGLYQKIKQITYMNPVGQQLEVGNSIFTIIGVAKPWTESSFVYANIDNAVMIPILTSGMLSKYSAINNIILKLSSNADIDTVKNNVTQYITQNVGEKRLFIRSAKELIAKMAKQSEILTIFLGLIGGVSLLVGGIGVMNIMLVSVVERRREIGIRLAVGAKRADIRALFLAEAVMLSFFGGMLGVMIGMLIAYIIALFSHWQFTLFLLPPLIGFTVSAITGVFFGFYPAYKASQLDPIQALRSE